MVNCFLQSYLSRSQVREYLAYMLDNGTSQIVQSPDNVHTNESLNIRIGSTVNSVKEYHVSRYLGQRTTGLSQGRIVLVADDVKPELEPGTSVVGVIYLSKYSKEYSGAKDNLIESEHNGDIGDVAWTSAANWGSSSFGATSEGTNYRLVVFWKDA